MLLYFVGTTLLAYILILGYISFKIKTISSDTAKQYLKVDSEIISERVKTLLEQPLFTVNTIARSFENYQTLQEKDRRPLFTEIIKNEIEQDKSILSIWTIWEQNSIDQMDEQNILHPTATITGNFAASFYREGEIIKNEINAGQPPYNKDFYKIPKQTGQLVILDPYFYSYLKDKSDSVLITSAIAPIISDNGFEGVIGIDFSLHSFQDSLSKIQPFGNGLVYLISTKGIFVNHPDDKLIGTSADNYFQKINQGLVFEQVKNTPVFHGKDPISGKKSIFITEKLAIGQTNEWIIITSVPESSIFKDANKAYIKTILLGLLGLLILAMVISYIAQAISGPISELSNKISLLSLGVISAKSTKKPLLEDEISDLRNSLEKLFDGMQASVNFAGEIGKGNLDASYQLLSEEDKLGNSLITMQEALKHAKSEKEKKKILDDQRNWVTHGLAKFGEIIRQESDNIEGFTMNILKQLLEYTNVAQGAIYIRLENEFNKNHMQFEAKAAMAFGKPIMLEKTVDNEDGLFGRVINENRIVYLQEIPETYVSFSGGVENKTKPRNLLIVPLTVNDLIYGLVELLSINKFADFEIEFIEKLCENIASVISSVNINIHTAKLLEQSKIQADELSQHEEEMRQNLEEMQATQEEASKRQNNLNSYIKAINLGMMVAQIDLKGRIIEMSPSMSGFYGISTENMKGKFYNAFIAQDEETRNEFITFWENLMVIGEGHRKQKLNVRNKDLLILENYRVIYEDNHPTKVLLLAMDKTREKELNEMLTAEIEAQNQHE
jgi:methyl-accepting chemotaxis protein